MASKKCPVCKQICNVTNGKFDAHQRGGPGTATCPNSNQSA